MKNYTQVESGFYESKRSEPEHPIDEKRIQEIVKDVAESDACASDGHPRAASLVYHGS
jgi:hypothetical protein